jgi:hypothetical protein
MTVAWIGWVATAVFATSYFVPKVSMLTKIQAVAACLWIAYGMKIGAVPVIAANLIVAGGALYSSFRNRDAGPKENAPMTTQATEPEQL